jgi:hypothetical protein
MRLPIAAMCICTGAVLATGRAPAAATSEPVSANSLTFSLGAVRFDTGDPPAILPTFAVELAHSFTPHAAGLIEIGSPLLLFFYPVYPHLLVGGRIHLSAPARGSLAPVVTLKAGPSFGLCPYECERSNALGVLATAGVGLEYITRDGLLLRLEVGRWFTRLEGYPRWFAGLAIGNH